MNIHEKEKMLIQRSENQTFINEIKSRIDQGFAMEIVTDYDHEKNIKIILFLFGIGILFGCKKNKLF